MARAPKRRQLKKPERQRQEKSASERGYDWKWTKVADAVRERDEWLCQDCLKEGGMCDDCLKNHTMCHECVRKGAMAIANDEMLSRPRNQDGSMRMPPVGHIIPGHKCKDFYDIANLRTQCDRHNALQREADTATYGSARR